VSAYWFMSFADAVTKCEARRIGYNEERPHSAIGNKPPTTQQKRSGTNGQQSGPESGRGSWTPLSLLITGEGPGRRSRYRSFQVHNLGCSTFADGKRESWCQQYHLTENALGHCVRYYVTCSRTMKRFWNCCLIFSDGNVPQLRHFHQNIARRPSSYLLMIQTQRVRQRISNFLNLFALSAQTMTHWPTWPKTAVQFKCVQLALP